MNRFDNYVAAVEVVGKLSRKEVKSLALSKGPLFFRLTKPHDMYVFASVAGIDQPYSYEDAIGRVNYYIDNGFTVKEGVHA